VGAGQKYKTDMEAGKAVLKNRPEEDLPSTTKSN